MTNLHGTGLKANRKCLLICSAVAIASMQYGIDTAAIGGLQAMPGFLMVFGFADTSNPLGYGIDSTVQQLMTSLMNLGAMVAAILSGVFGAYFGRKPALWLACLVCFAAVALQIGSTSTTGLYVGRLLLGCSNGFFVIFSTVYCSEAAPAHLREIMVGLFSVYVNIGSIIGSIVDNYTKHHMNKSSYRIPLSCMFVVPALLSIFLFIVPESPRWLLHHERNDEARKSLGALRSGFTEDVEFEWAEMVRGVAEEKRISRGTSFADMLRGSNLRRTLLCYGTIAAQSASGVWFFIGYQTYFLSLAGITKAFEYTVMNTCIGFLGVFVGLFSLNKLCGRRSVMIAGAVSCGICQLSTGIASSVAPGTKEMGNVLVAFTGLFNFCYNAGVGAASTPIATELVSSRLRAWTVGSANALGYFLAWLVGFCSPYFINPQDLNWGAQYSYIWAASNFICVIWFYFALPETKARSLEELDEIFEAGVAARKFRQYRCSIVEEARQDVLGQHQAQTTKQAD